MNIDLQPNPHYGQALLQSYAPMIGLMHNVINLFGSYVQEANVIDRQQQRFKQAIFETRMVRSGLMLRTGKRARRWRRAANKFRRLVHHRTEIRIP